MTPAPDLPADPALIAALIAWQAELGADEAIGDAPLDRFALPAVPAAVAPPVAPSSGARERAAPLPAAAPAPPGADLAAAVAEAEALAAAAPDLAALSAAQSGYGHCDLRQGARSFVFADGRPGARVMILGEAPGREEDIEGRPFVGRAGQLLDKMFAAIGLGRGAPDPARALYIANVLPWRPPGNRDPEPDEVAMMLPFVRRHIALAAPEVLVLMGNAPAGAILGRRGITRLRGIWTEALGLKVLPMLHPAYLLRNPAAKADAWADLLALQQRLRTP
jgi:DNA polymerase